MTVEMRKLEPAASDEDFAALMAARPELYGSGNDLKYLSYTFKSVEESTYSRWLRGHREAGIDYHAALDEDERIAGLCVVKADGVAGFEIMTLSVRGDCRRQGIGRDLLEHALELAEEDGFASVEVSVFADNRPMLLLVVGSGFVPFAMDHGRRADGADLVRLRRRLG